MKIAKLKILFGLSQKFSENSTTVFISLSLFSYSKDCFQMSQIALCLFGYPFKYTRIVFFLKGTELCKFQFGVLKLI